MQKCIIRSNLAIGAVAELQSFRAKKWRAALLPGRLQFGGGPSRVRPPAGMRTRRLQFARDSFRCDFNAAVAESVIHFTV